MIFVKLLDYKNITYSYDITNYFISSCGNFIVVDKFSIDKLLKYNAVSEKTDTELLFNYFIIDSKSLKYKND